MKKKEKKKRKTCAPAFKNCFPPSGAITAGNIPSGQLSFHFYIFIDHSIAPRLGIVWLWFFFSFHLLNIPPFISCFSIFFFFLFFHSFCTLLFERKFPTLYLLIVSFFSPRSLTSVCCYFYDGLHVDGSMVSEPAPVSLPPDASETTPLLLAVRPQKKNAITLARANCLCSVLSTAIYIFNA
ncbi:Uncharacterized protein APZ42_029273 [Daphnia magna]|uniref:Uncharacterized protein n=1 Tax=Daphnia magna TaxID=35525 RepID=A0A162EB69_9CRUS|nr:Uncharacterized protein APZ42_029273 [Daphnia magna]